MAKPLSPSTLESINTARRSIGDLSPAQIFELSTQGLIELDGSGGLTLSKKANRGETRSTRKAEIEAILSAVIPGSPEISNRTMNEINQLIEAQKRDVEQKLALIAANPLNLLLKEREAHEAKIADIDAKLRSLCKEIGVDLGSGASGAEASLHERSTVSASDLSEKLVAELKNAPQGMSQIDLSKATGCSYSAVMKWVKENPDTVKTTGEKRGKKVFLV